MYNLHKFALFIISFSKLEPCFILRQTSRATQKKKKENKLFPYRKKSHKTNWEKKMDTDYFSLYLNVKKGESVSLLYIMHKTLSIHHTTVFI